MKVAGARRTNRTRPGRWQKFTRRREYWGWKALGLLIPGLGLFAAFVLQPEAALANGPALLIDNLLRGLAALTVAATATVVLADDRLAERAAFIASAACLLLGVAVLFSAAWTPFRDWRAMAAAAVATAASGANLIRLRNVWKGIKGLTSKVVIAVLTVSAVPAFNFWSETSYLPSRNAASLQLTTEAVVQKAPDGGEHWIIRSAIRNLSDVRAFVIASGLTACRWHDEAHWQRDTETANGATEHCEQLVAPFDERSWLDPGATLRVSTPARIHAGLPLLQVRLRVAYARADRVIEVLDSGRDATADERGRCADAHVWGLQPQSRLAALARRELAMMYADVEGDGGRTYFFGAADSVRCARRPDDPRLNQTRFQDLNQYLSLTEATTVWASWPAAPTADAPAN